jgi:N-acetylglucosaminyldiphosphoundecaprenol N-acetyl-beta-D-mannosaminyltransferase
MLNHVINLLNIKINPVSIDDALNIVVQHITNKEGDYFCFINIHIIMECQKDDYLKKVINNSKGNFADGMGIAWALNLLGFKFKGRVRGTDFIFKLSDYAENNNLKIFLYGNKENTIQCLKNKLEMIFPKLKIIGMISPPFRPLTKEEDESFIKQINDSGADILFVSLGAPKQEKWMYEHRGRIKPIQFGVGAAFDFIAGEIKQAPIWMQKCGLEWLYRLPQQPYKTIYRMLLAPKFIFKIIILLVKKYIHN